MGLPAEEAEWGYAVEKGNKLFSYARVKEDKR